VDQEVKGEASVFILSVVRSIQGIHSYHIYARTLATISCSDIMTSMILVCSCCWAVGEDFLEMKNLIFRID